MFDKLKELMQLKSKMEEIKRKLDAETVEAASSDGSIYIKMSGSQEVKEFKFKADLKSADAGKLEKAILETFNRALKLSQQLAAKKMGEVTGMQLPGM
jgi:DNA-binding protein YbaB